MSIPQTTGQMNCQIDQDITNKTGQARSITPATLGNLLKTMTNFSDSFFLQQALKAQPNGVASLDNTGKVPTAQLPPMDGGSSGVWFKKDPTLTAAHIGLLAMQRSVLKPGAPNPPTSADHLDISAVLCDTVPAEPGTKGIYELNFGGIKLEKPVTKIIRVQFTDGNNIPEGSYLQFQLGSGYPNLSFMTNTEGPDTAMIGATLADTITSVIYVINTNYAYNVAVYEVGADYIDFEMLVNSADYKKYTENSAIIPNSTAVFTITTQRELNIPAAQRAQNISNAMYNWKLVEYSGFPTYNSNYPILGFDEVFSSSVQPYGTTGAFGLRYFADENEVIQALNWALQIGNNTNFSDLFNITEELTYNVGTNTYTIVIEDKNAPSGSNDVWFGNNFDANQSGVSQDTSIITSPVGAKPEHIPYPVLGVIMNVNEVTDEVLISTSYISELTVCSAADGATFVAPLQVADLFVDDDFAYWSFVVAWRGGKVMPLGDLQAIYEEAGYSSDMAFTIIIFIGGIFRALTAANADGKVMADRNFTFGG